MISSLRRHTLPIVFAFVLGAVPFARAQESRENADYKLAISLYNDGMTDLAIDQFRRFIENYPSGAQGIEARFMLGLAQLRAGNADEARVTFQNFALAYPDHPKSAEAWLRTGEAFEKLGNAGEAAAAYERARVFHPKDPLAPEALYRAGAMYRQAGNGTSAKNCFRLIAREYATSKRAFSARLALGMIDADEGNLDLAGKEINLSVERANTPEERGEAVVTLAQFQARAGLLVTADSTLTQYLRTAGSSPYRSQARLRLGLLLHQRKLHAQAIELLRPLQADTLLPDSLHILCLAKLGEAYSDAGNDGAALTQFTALLGLPGRNAAARDARLGAARSAIRLGRSQEALSFLAPLLVDGPAATEAASLAARACVMAGRYSEAATWYTALIDRAQIARERIQTMERLADIATEHLHNPQQSIALLTRIAEQFPNSPSAPAALRRIAEIEEAHNDAAGALATYQDFLRRFPAADSIEAVRRAAGSLAERGPAQSDSGIKAMASAVAALLSGGSKSGAYFRLGIVYYQYLHDYQSARECFQQALKEPGPPSDEAALYLARAVARDAAQRQISAADALGAYNDFLARHAASPLAETARMELYELERRTAGDAGMAALADRTLKDPALTPELRRRCTADLFLAAMRTGDTVTAGTLLVPALAAASPSDRATLLLSAGDIFARKGLADSAAALWREAASLLPPVRATADALARLFDLQMRRGNPGRAVDAGARLIDEFGYTETASRATDRYLQALAAAGRYDEAARRASSLLSETQDGRFDPALLVRRGEIFERQGAMSRAADDYRTYLLSFNDGPLAANACLALGNITKAQGNPALASLYFREAQSYGMTSAPTRTTADLLFQNEQYAQAARAYTDLAQSPDTLALRPYYAAQAIVSSFRGDDASGGDRLQAQFKDALQQSPALLAQIDYERALSLYRKQDYTRARSLFQHVRSEYDKSRFASWSRFYLAKILEVTNKLEDAAHAYEEILKDDAASDAAPRALLSLGNMHFNAERYEQAVACYQKILADSVRGSDVIPYALNNLIDAYTSLKVYDAALTTARHFIRQYPNDESVPDKQITIGTLYTKMGYYDQAVQQFQAMLTEGAAEDQELLYNIGEAYYYKGDYQQSILEFLKVPYLTTRQAKTNWTATSLYMAGQAYEKLSKLQEAVGMYQQIIDRPGIDATFKAAARKEVNRVKSLMGNQ